MMKNKISETGKYLITRLKNILILGKCSRINMIFYVALTQFWVTVLFLLMPETNPNWIVGENDIKEILVERKFFNATDNSHEWPKDCSSLSVDLIWKETLFGLNSVEVVSFGNQHLTRCRKTSNRKPRCSISTQKKRLKVEVENRKEITLGLLSQKFRGLHTGGHYKPVECMSNYKVAILVPYKNRFHQLRVFLNHMHDFMQRQQIVYRIFVIELEKHISFNKGVIMNAGFREASKIDNYDCFVFHDVDLLPEDDRNIYKCSEESPTHFSVAVNTLKYKLPYRDIFGGVTAMTSNQFEAVNGYSNKFWGWGGEDDDMYNRIHLNSMTVSRYPEDIARYTMLLHNRDWKPNKMRFKMLEVGDKRWFIDGLNSLSYEVVSSKSSKLYTYFRFSIDVNDIVFHPQLNISDKITTSTTTLKPKIKGKRKIFSKAKRKNVRSYSYVFKKELDMSLEEIVSLNEPTFMFKEINNVNYVYATQNHRNIVNKVNIGDKQPYHSTNRKKYRKYRTGTVRSGLDPNPFVKSLQDVLRKE